ncbi:hypothetical protein PR202_ga07116 [Eleusine coracana subsp. coracana]|uniref:Secreted protein n=1 Tax=Eleusine coracana subsp. coracana TaxID=191504 RepID=A0AAV5BXU8_ELECO|nr:hypothetical protein PR202_ga07116 [Eleusine coracana subsp. coracana]
MSWRFLLRRLARSATPRPNPSPRCRHLLFAFAFAFASFTAPTAAVAGDGTDWKQPIHLPLLPPLLYAVRASAR